MTRLRRLVNHRDEGVAFLSVILLMTMVTFFAIVLLGLVLAQTTPTLLANKNSRTLVAAQAGIDAAVGQFRNATAPDISGQIMGDIHKLPCTVKGTVDGTGGATHYVTSIRYFTEDPDGQSESWREANALTCYTGTGTNGGLRAVPSFAVMTSEGFDDTATAMADRADRIIEAQYTFQLTTIKVSGGLIMDANSAFCLVATGLTDSATTYIRYQPASSADCATDSAYNLWSWRNDYMIHLTSSDADGKTPLCITGRNTGSANPSKMRLKACTTGTKDPDGQRWSWTGDYTWRGQNANNDAYADSYIVNQDATVDAGDYLSVANTPTYRSLTPTGAVGKGNASKATDQVVNQNLFGRCLDVTNEKINYSYLIAYPCKQDPSGKGGFSWNHKWRYTEPDEGVEWVSTQIKVTPGSTYCLISTTATGLKGSPYYEGYDKAFPRFVKGTSTLDCSDTSTWWKRYGFSYDPTKSYTFQDKDGKCLSANGPMITEDGGAGTWTSIILATCDGSDGQKWNVPDSPVGASIGEYEEVTGRAGG